MSPPSISQSEKSPNELNPGFSKKFKIPKGTQKFQIFPSPFSPSPSLNLEPLESLKNQQWPEVAEHWAMDAGYSFLTSVGRPKNYPEENFLQNRYASFLRLFLQEF